MRLNFVTSASLVILAIVAFSFWWTPILWSLLLVLPLVGLGIFDVYQSPRAIRRNFPIWGRLRYVMEDLRPKIYQYFVESDTDGKPFSRIHRNVIYQRAKKQMDTVPFGTQLDVYENNYEWLNHSIKALSMKTIDTDPRVLVGGPDCKQPYSASVYNISAMSYGSLSKNAIMSFNEGALLGNFAHNTGEGSISDHHLRGGDLIWQIGTGYFGCRYPDGTFNSEAFREKATLPTVKMIEIKLSQGAKPGHGGMLPGSKVTEEIARIRLVEIGKNVDSPSYHSAFTTPLEFVFFIKKLRELSDGKPIGFKLCIGHKSEFVAICKAMVQTKIYPDFITVDGGEGGTGAAPLEFSNHVGMPLRNALAFVYDALTGFDLKRHIKIIASGKVTNGFDLVKNFALGADMCNSARGMMIAIGCIQALECNKNTCPTGVATQNPKLVRGLVVEDKKKRVANFHNETVKSASELLAAAGLKHPSDIHRVYIQRRISPDKVLTYLDSYPYIPNGSLLQEPYAKQFETIMAISSAESFTPNFDNLDWDNLAWARKPLSN